MTPKNKGCGKKCDCFECEDYYLCNHVKIESRQFYNCCIMVVSLAVLFLSVSGFAVFKLIQHIMEMCNE